MRNLGKKAWVVYYSWLKKEPSWSACFFIDRGIGRIILFETKKKAKEYAKIQRETGVITKIVCWEGKKE